MNDDKGEGVAIANLIGTDGCSVVGWVYRWTTGAHVVMWDVHGPKPVSEIRPDLTAEQKQEIDFDALTQIGRDEGG
ncbi:hypothetical protein [Sulfitobacter pontiacus]|uniref:hypothetical protein n=1 Tax=Sulfitobacter pontiacus TaxID=60137 RepID=UPI001B0F30CB|nr:hypothetical protein [Sulfitobacter pontiacus]MBO6854534.1 hypothetical protein [Marivivens sp.]GLO80169.1 hypothetical protein MACH23_35900 [Sulfitobacter pontiacus]